MAGEKDLKVLLKNMNPHLQQGDFVFCTVVKIPELGMEDIIMLFREIEGYTLILERNIADSKGLSYDSIMSWITLEIHSSLDAVGLTAAFSNALGKNNISCNVVAAYYHDHIFVGKEDTNKAMQTLSHM